MKKLILLILSSFLLFFSCKPKEVAMVSSPIKLKKEMTKAEKIISKTISAHGGKKYDTAHYQFVFRNKKYSFHHENSNYTYTLNYKKDGRTNFIELNNEGLTKIVDGKKIELSKKEYDSHVGSLNSVIYFATLPHKLSDPAVNTSFKGETSIKGKQYYIIEITFNEEGGGQDHDDEFYYWINQDTNRIDYLAYNYQVNNGGVRFRSAYNPRVVDGILFQDYVNYKAEVGTPLADLPDLFKKEALKKLSVIETEEVVNLK